MRWMKLSCPARDARTSIAPNWFVVPDATSLPGCLSTGIDSPVTADSPMLVAPDTTTPSTGTASPGSTRTIWPSSTSAAAISPSAPPARTTRAVRGVSSTSF